MTIENINAQSSRSVNNSLDDLQSILRDAATMTKSSDEVSRGVRPEKSMYLETLIYQRRHYRINSERQRLSKSIFKVARQELRKWRTM